MSLKTIRLARGLTLSELNKMSGINIVTLNRIECGKINVANITLRNAVKLADALCIDPRELLKEAEDNA